MFRRLQRRSRVMHPGRFPPSVENPQTVTNAAGIEGLEAPGEPRKGPGRNSLQAAAGRPT